jgi:GH3 auxin-responsive promoter
MARTTAPDRDRAKQLEALANKNGSLYPKDYWNLRLLGCWLGGTVGHQSRELHQYFGPAPQRDLGYVSTEGRHTVPLEDGTSCGPLVPDGMFYEFEPENSGDVLLPQDLSPGGLYSVLITSSNGLYRYRIGDLVRCRGFFGQSPLLEFVRKTGDYRDLEGEKISGQQVVLAVDTAIRRLELPVSSRFSLSPNRPAKGAPNYSVVIESFAGNSDAVERRLASEIDLELKQMNLMYAQKRSDGSLREPNVVALSGDVWDKYTSTLVKGRGTGETQFKHPPFVELSQLQGRPPLARA